MKKPTTPRVSSKNVGRRRRRRPVAIDLFSGAGGLTLGLRWAGFRVAGAIENDPLAIRTYRHHHPRTRVWKKDIRKVTVAEVMRRLRLQPRRLDLLAGCPPCQSFSSMRTLNGGRRVRDPEQKDLLLEFMRFVRVLRPKAIMMENVPGLASDRRMGELRRNLRKLGYWSKYRILNTSDYGVPQRRRRIILLGGRLGALTFAPARNVSRTVRDAIGHLPVPKESRDPLHAVSEMRSDKVLALLKKVPKNGGSRTDLPDTEQLACHKRLHGFNDVYGRMSWDDVSPTITSGFVNPSKGRFLHPRQNRAITPREAALLQGFPAYYKFSMERGKFPAAVLIGNALPPRFIKLLALPVAAYVRQAAT